MAAAMTTWSSLAHSLRSQSLFQFVQISDEYYKHFLLQYFSHFVNDQMDSNLANLEAAVKAEYIPECLSLTTQW